MTYKELELLLLALPQEESLRLLQLLAEKCSGIGEAGIEYNVTGESAVMEAQVRLLIEKLSHLPPERRAEVGDFIDFLSQREQAQPFGKTYAHASEASFAAVWENDDDALYDKL